MSLCKNKICGKLLAMMTVILLNGLMLNVRTDKKAGAMIIHSQINIQDQVYQPVIWSDQTKGLIYFTAEQTLQLKRS